jgi:acetyl esterase/lipase
MDRPPPLDPELEPLVALFPDLVLADDNIGAIRSIFPVPPLRAAPGTTCFDRVVDDRTGVVVRVHRPDDSADRVLPCVYSMHGGGYVTGGRWMDDERLGRWSRELGCVCVSVEYRLAPEHPHPIPLDDCHAGLAWVFDHAAELGVDPARVGVAGISAGGGLAAALALLVRDRGDLPLHFQLLEAPMLDDRQTTPSSRCDGLAIWTRESNTFGWRSYLGTLAGDAVTQYAAPSRATDLSGLPPTFMCVGSADGFLDEDVDYAARLEEAGVPTEVHVYPGAPHGFELFSASGVARRALADIEAWLAVHLL